MAIERFTREQFEQALPADRWEMISADSEYTYAIPVDNTNKRIVIRSSVSPRSGIADGTGKDSIRVWIEYRYRQMWRALGKDDVRWTTRVAGWEQRLDARIRDAWKLAIADSKRRATITKQAEQKPEKKEMTTASADNSDLNLFAAAASATSAPAPAPAIPDCPKDGAPMRKRQNRRTKEEFWGCSNYPRCKGTRPIKATANFGGTADQIKMVSKKKFPPSPLQEAIYKFIQTGSGHGVIDAKAGTGKTTTNVGCLEFIDPSLKVALMAFNKHIAKEQALMAPDNVTATTCHSQGYSNFRDRWPNAKFNGRKFWQHFTEYKNRCSDSEWVAVDENAGQIAKLVSLAKGTMTYPEPERLRVLCDKYGINLLNDLPGTEIYVFDAVRAIWASTTDDTSSCDFDDMIYFSAANLVPCEKFDFIIVDEAQDLNKAQIQMAFNSLKPGGRLVATGDEFQSMYGFRGADADAIPNIIVQMDGPTILPLSVSYRCPTSVVDLVNAEFPAIEFTAAPNAKTGTVETISDGFMATYAKSGDLVLCRTNAPLVKVCYDFIRAGKKASIRGRDIGKGLVDLIKKIQKRESIYNLGDLLKELERYSRYEVSKLVKAKKFSRAAMIEDQVETIIAVADGVHTVQEVINRIESIFRDDDIGVVCSSVHRAKGDEAETVWIIEPSLMPHPLAEQDWELQQEQNIKYVAYTRTKDRLYFVS